jgi:hypothetical protein
MISFSEAGGRTRLDIKRGPCIAALTESSRNETIMSSKFDKEGCRETDYWP